jgi:hypothetical protein
MGLEAWISTRANRSRKSFKHLYSRSSQNEIRHKETTTNFQMQLSCSQYDMLTSLLLEAFYARIRLAE